MAALFNGAGDLNYDGWSLGAPSSTRDQQERRCMGGTAGERLDRGARSPRFKKASERYSVSFPVLSGSVG